LKHKHNLLTELHAFSVKFLTPKVYRIIKFLTNIHAYKAFFNQRACEIYLEIKTMDYVRVWEAFELEFAGNGGRNK